MAIVATQTSTVLGGKELMESVEKSLRLSRFDAAFRTCSELVTSSDFKSWKGKKKHDAVKMHIVCGKHNNRSSSVLNWITEHKDLPDYALYLCEWVNIELDGTDVITCRGVTNSTLKKIETELTTAIEWMKQDSQNSQTCSKDLSMCLELLVDKLYLPRGDTQKAELLVKEHQGTISKEIEEKIKQKIGESRTKAVAVARKRQSTSAASGSSVAAARQFARPQPTHRASPMDTSNLLQSIQSFLWDNRTAIGCCLLGYLISRLFTSRQRETEV